MHVVTVKRYEANSGKQYEDREDAAKDDLKAALSEILLKTLPASVIEDFNVLDSLTTEIDAVEAAIEQYHMDAGH